MFAMAEQRSFHVGLEQLRPQLVALSVRVEQVRCEQLGTSRAEVRIGQPAHRYSVDAVEVGDNQLVGPVDHGAAVCDGRAEGARQREETSLLGQEVQQGGE